MESAPFISIVIPVRNEEAALPALLQSLARQNYPSHSFEIIVADGRSSDNTPDIVRAFAASSCIRITLVDNPGVRSSSGRNAGVRASRGDIVVFIDGHCTLPSSDLLQDTASLFSQTVADCLCRPQPLRAPPRTWLAQVIAAVRASPLGHGKDSLIYDMNAIGFVDPASSGASYRRSVFDTIGFYDETFDACEDVDFNIRVRQAGFCAYTDPRLAVYYQPRSSRRALFTQMVRYGRGRVRLVQKHPGAFSLSQFAPAVLVMWTILTAVLWLPLFPVWLRTAFSVPLVLYLIALLAASFRVSRTFGLRAFLPALTIYAAIHFGLGSGCWLEGFHTVSSLLHTRHPSSRQHAANRCASEQNSQPKVSL